jgi:CheY-specific phosphatase CheX
MIASEAKTVITQSLSQALERMAFLDVLQYPEIPLVPAQFVLAEIRFAGSVTGSIQVAASLEFARELASNMGLLDHPSEYQCLDAIKELVNVTCGLVLPLLATPDADVFDLSIPQAVPCDESTDWTLWIRQDDVVVLDVGGYPVAARLNLRS